MIFRCIKKLIGQVKKFVTGTLPLALLFFFCFDPSAWSSQAGWTRGMVVSSSVDASRVGQDILKMGGNAVDAAVAVGFALAVTYPEAGNLGGGGFAVVRTPGDEVFTLDHRERAPLKASAGMFLTETGSLDSNLSLESHLASGTPGTVDGLLVLHERFGRLSWQTVLAPAITLAEEGFLLNSTLAGRLKALLPELVDRPASMAKFSIAGQPMDEGHLWQQPDLAETLKLIAAKKREGFYGGKVAALLLAEMARGGGLIEQVDLDRYRSVWREPIQGQYRGYDIYSMAPPSSGGILLVQMLNMLSAYPVGAMGAGSPELLHLMIEVERRAYADRAQYLGDADFYPVPQAKLLEREYARQRMASFDPKKASASRLVSHGVWLESPETTHYSVIDGEGMMVALTTTLNSSFGNKWVIPGAGFLMNNEMDDFAASTTEANQYGLLGAQANAIEPGKRMLSSMTPTLVLKAGQPVLVTGSPGGSTIITTVLQVILNVIDHGMTGAEAVAARRVHHQWQPDTVSYEVGAISDAGLETLKAMGHQLITEQVIGDANTIWVQEGRFFGGKDPREPGAALGH